MCEVSLGDGTGDPCGAALGGHVGYSWGRCGRWNTDFWTCQDWASPMIINGLVIYGGRGCEHFGDALGQPAKFGDAWDRLGEHFGGVQR